MAFSDLTSQIGTNYIPSEEELDHIKNSILPEPTAKLADLETEINHVQEIYSTRSYGTATGAVGRNRGISQPDLTSASASNRRSLGDLPPYSTHNS